MILAGRLKELQVIHILTGLIGAILLSFVFLDLCLIAEMNLSLPIGIAAYYGIENSFRKLAPLVLQVSGFNIPLSEGQSVTFHAKLEQATNASFLFNCSFILQH